MSNTYFQFQQFRIDQSDCAQKVSTDACLLGAVADLTGATHILDIGTGTGLLALMAAQRAPAATIEAVELDPAAATQAAANVAASFWPDRIRVRPLSLADYAATRPAPFSHIICNPPFFRHSLASPDVTRATARHASAASLTFDDLATFAARFLAAAGTLTVLLPPPEMVHFGATAQQAGLAIQARLRVRHRAGGRGTREIAQFGRETGAARRETDLIIEQEPGKYSDAFRTLLSGFYLGL